LKKKYLCRNLSLRLKKKSKGLQRCGSRGKPRSHISCSRECKRVWGNEPSNSQVNFHLESWNLKWTPESLENNCKGQNLIDWGVPCIIENLLERRCLKWACMTHLTIWNTSYGQKKGRESNWQFDSRPLKVGNLLNFVVFRWRETYRWKDLDKRYNFSLDFIAIKGLHAKLWAPKVMGVRVMGILGLPSRSLGTKCHLDVGHVERHKIYYKGEGGGFPQVQAMVSLVSLSLHVARPNTKSVQTVH
jgi:hypothetical protein